MALTCKPSGWIASVVWALRAQMKLQRQSENRRQMVCHLAVVPGGEDRLCQCIVICKTGRTYELRRRSAPDIEDLHGYCHVVFPRDHPVRCTQSMVCKSRVCNAPWMEECGRTIESIMKRPGICYGFFD